MTMSDFLRMLAGWGTSAIGIGFMVGTIVASVRTVRWQRLKYAEIEAYRAAAFAEIDRHRGEMVDRMQRTFRPAGGLADVWNQCNASYRAAGREIAFCQRPTGHDGAHHDSIMTGGFSWVEV